MTRLRCCLVAAGMLAACAPAHGVATRETLMAVTDSVTAASAAWKSAAEHADADGILSFYDNAPHRAAIADAGHVERGSLAFEAFAKRLPVDLAKTRLQSIEVHDQSVTALGLDAAAETAVGSWTTTEKSGKVTPATFAYSRVWVLRDGHWKIQHSSLSVVPIPAPVRAPVRVPARPAKRR